MIVVSMQQLHDAVIYFNCLKDRVCVSGTLEGVEGDSGIDNFCGHGT